MGRADACEKEAKVVVDFGDGADGRARVAVGGLLLDRDRRAQPFDVVDIGFFHLFEELAGVRRKTFDVAPLPFGVDGVKSEARLARPAQPRDDHELVPWDGQGQVGQVMFPGPLDQNGVMGGLLARWHG